MFGYIKPYKPDLTLGEFEIYKGVYCGLCKQIGKIYNWIYRFSLNYDFAFLAILSLSTNYSFKGFEKSVCSFNPLKKKTCLKACDDLSFTTTLGIIMLYYKIKDDIYDSKFFLKFFKKIILFFMKPARKKAIRLYPEIDDILSDAMYKQLDIEDSNNISIDMACDPTSNAMAYIFSTLSENDSQKKVLKKMGYYLGKWVYLIDSLDDLQDDIKNGTYNPFLKKYSLKNYSKDDIIKISNYGNAILNNVIAELALTYELLDVYRYKSIIDNIIYLGLKNTQKNIFEKRGIAINE